MTIFPASFNQASFKLVELTTLDIAVPEKAMDTTDRYQWTLYIKNVPLATKLKKYGEAIDALILSSGDKTKALLDAAYVVHNELQAFQIPTTTAKYDDFSSDFSFAMHGISTFLKASQSPDAAVWEARKAAFEGYLASRSLANKGNNASPKP